MMPVFLVSILIIYLIVPLRQVQVFTPWDVMGTAALVFACFFIGHGAAKATAKKIQKTQPGKSTRYLSRFRKLRVLIIIFSFVCIYFFHWHIAVLQLLNTVSFIPLIADLLFILPLLLMIAAFMSSERQLLTLVKSHGKHKKKLALHTRISDLAGYLKFRFRLELGIVLFPWAFIIFVTDLKSSLTEPDLLTEFFFYAALTCFLIFFGPFMLRIIWPTRQMAEGSLKQKLKAFAKSVNFRCRDIRLWQTNMQFPNAAVIGFTGPLRLVFITDLLLAHCSSDEIEAIFGHEAGHAKKHHFIFYILIVIIYATIFLTVAGLFLRRGYSGLSWFYNPDAASGPTYLATVSVFVYTIVYWRYFFGFVSRRFEREADLFSIKNISNPNALLSALRKIGLLSGQRPSKDSWRHFSIEKRREFLKHVLTSEAGFRKAITIAAFLKYLIFASAVMSVIVSFFLFYF